LDALDTLIVKWGTSVGVWDQVFLGTVDNGAMLVWRQLRLVRSGVFILDEELVDVAIHGEATFAGDVIPCDINASKFTAGPVGGDSVIRLESLEEVVRMLASGVLNAEVIYDEDKDDRAPIVTPKAWGGSTLVVSVLGQSCSQEVIGEFAGLFKAVDSFVYFEVDPVIDDKLGEVVFVNKFLWDSG
jgi:hypothetical protein